MNLDDRLDDLVTDYWFQHYTKNGLCSLCGNLGVLDTRGVKSPAGVECGGLHYCVCPNGQVMRYEKAVIGRSE